MGRLLSFLGVWMARALAILCIRLVYALGYLGCLVATQASVGVLSWLLNQRHIAVPTRTLGARLAVGFLVGLAWALALAALAFLAFGSWEASWVALGPGLILGSLTGFHAGRWWGLESLGRWPTSLTLGRLRERPFFVSTPYVVSGSERLKHLALDGPTGSGKTTLVRRLVVADLSSGAGLAVIDPKDDLVDSLLAHIPPEREEDTIVFDITDTEYPLGFNPLSGIPPEGRTLATGELISVFRRYFAESWGSRLEHILRNVILALLEVPQATLLDVPRLLLQPDFREHVLSHLTNPGVRRFLSVEFEETLRRGDAIQPILNKVGPWLSYPELRNVVGQATSSFDVRRVIDRGQVLLVRIPQGALGEDVSTLLGSLIVAKIQLAAHSRVNIPPDKRRPFYLYCDEFQNFATSSFDRILTEARAFKLGLVCCNQYPEQLPRELQLAISRNVATRVHSLHQRGHYFLQVGRLEDAGQEAQPLIFPASSPLPPGRPERAARIRAISRARYGRPRAEAEREILSRLGGTPSSAGDSGPRPRRRPSQRVSGRVDIDEE